MTPVVIFSDVNLILTALLVQIDGPCFVLTRLNVSIQRSSWGAGTSVNTLDHLIMTENISTRIDNSEMRADGTWIHSAVSCGFHIFAAWTIEDILFVQRDFQVAVNSHDYCFQMEQKLNIVTIQTPDRKHLKRTRWTSTKKNFTE